MAIKSRKKQRSCYPSFNLLTLVVGINYRNDILFLFYSFSLHLCPGMSSKEIYGNSKLQNVLFFFLIILMWIQRLFLFRIYWHFMLCFWNLWVTVGYINAEKFCKSFCREYFRKLLIDVIKYYTVLPTCFILLFCISPDHRINQCMFLVSN